MWKQVESALANVTANELLSALCIHADETSAALAQKTTDIDIAKDAEKLRYEMFILSMPLNLISNLCFCLVLLTSLGLCFTDIVV